MAYNPNAPADTQFLADFPPEMREQLRAIIEDEIVNALKLCGLSPGNANSNIAVNNGALCSNLNADKLDGKDATAFSLTDHVHSAATQNNDGFMSNTDKVKLDGVAAGAEVNQNAFANVKVGTATIQADAKQDTLELEGGQNITLTGDGVNDKVTVGFSGVLPVENGGTGVSTDNKYLKLTGGTVSGSITSTHAVPLKVTTTYNDNSGTTCTSDILRANTSNSEYGNNVALGGGGNAVVGGGESYSAQLNALAGDSGENCYICADGTVYIKPNCNTFPNAKVFAFTTDGKIQFPDGTKIWIE